MRLETRLRKLEALFPRPSPPGPCRSCSIDFTTGRGSFGPGIMLSAPGGTYCVACEGCLRCFRGRCARLPGGRVAVEGAVPIDSILERPGPWTHG